MLKTPLCELLGIEKPVFQGGMAWIADASLASAVSEAGGLGIIAAMNADANWLRDQIHELRTKTDKPFGVNVMLMSPFADQVAQVVIDEQVPVVVTGAGNPTKYMKAWNDAGIKVIPVVASVALARLVARRGATAVVAEGTESGGHIGETSTMALVPQVVDAVDVPVVAAGGIADGRGVAAAFMLGAAGVQVGTRFLVADECTVSEQYKELVLKAGDTSTRATGRSTGHPVRALKSPFTNAYAKSEAAGASAEELGAMGTGALRKAAKDGNYEEGSFLCGQIAGMVNERQSAREIVDDLVDGAERVLKGASTWVAYLFAGQGAQHPAMGVDLIEASPAAAEVFAIADEVRPGTSEQCRSASKEELSQTENTQPCVFVHDLAAAVALRERGVAPAACAGFSLGEVAALTFAGAFDTRAGFELVCERAALMAAAAERHPGGMRAVIKLDAAQVEDLAKRAGEDCWPVNYNSPQQTVVAGAPDELQTLDVLVKEAGGRAMKVAVSGAFHSPYMAEATEGLATYIQAGHAPSPLLIPVMANMTAAPYPADPRAASDVLANQVSHAVRWVDTLHTLQDQGIDTFIEVGPGKTLSGLVKRTLSDVHVYSCETAEQVAAIADEFA